jgi:hypothetical protein
MSLYNTKPPEDGANNSCNYILDDFVNGLTEKSKNKDGENVIDKGKAKNYSNGSDNSDDMNNNNFGDSDSSSSDEDNKALRYIGQ